jgi:autophagy-related protein 18
MQVTKSLTHSVGGYLPNTLTEMWEPSRDFAFLRLPTSGARCVVALSRYYKLVAISVLFLLLIMSYSTMPHVMVISSEGYFYLYSIDLESGGECALIKQYR